MGGGVVCSRCGSNLLNISAVCEDIIVTYNSRQFQLRVVDNAVRIRPGYQLTGNIICELGSPQDRGMGRIRKWTLERVQQWL